MNVTQQAASKVVAELIGLRILEAAPAKDRRAKSIHLSERSWQSVRLARRARAKIDEFLVAATGEKDHKRAKSILLTGLGALGGMERIRSRRVRLPR